jgi:hypothetical protein
MPVLQLLVSTLLTVENTPVVDTGSTTDNFEKNIIGIWKPKNTPRKKNHTFLYSKQGMLSPQKITSTFKPECLS